MRYSSGSSELLGYAVLTLTLRLNGQAEGGVACKDQQGRSYESGYHYIPGPEPCTLCVCDNGNPNRCKTIICTLPQESLPKENCKSFRIGNTCCEFICVDDTLSSVTKVDKSAGNSGNADKPEGNSGSAEDGSTYNDLGLRLVASCVTAVLSLTLLFFLIHRLRQRKIRVCMAGRQSRRLADDQRSLGGMGYLERDGLTRGVPMDDMPCGIGYSLWKRPGNYFPPGEAPPPYEEAVAAARAEQALLSSMTPRALSPLTFPTTYLSSHNNHASVAIVANSQGTLSATSPNLSTDHGASTSPLIPPPSANRPLSSPNAFLKTHQSSQNEASSMGFYTGTSTTSFNVVGTNTYENLPTPVSVSSVVSQHAAVQSNALPLPGTHAAAAAAAAHQHHTTLPRQGGAFTISATLPSSDTSTHRTIPRTLATSGSLKLRREFTTRPLFDTPPKNVSPQHSPQSAPPIGLSNESAMRSDAFYEDVLVGPPSAPPQVEGRPPGSNSTTISDFKRATKSTNPAQVNRDGSIESVTCPCSMQALPTLHDDADDYRSECENCKSATGSRYYLDNEDELVTSPHETMTLHRRPEETTSNATPQYYRTSLTLPTNTRQRTRSTGARDNWFSSMPESSTESSDDD